MEKTIKYLENGEYHYATVRSVGDLAQLKTDSKETLVEAINELWNGGGNADPSKAPKPEGYDQLVQDVADAVKNQQEISQQWIEWQNEEAQLTEGRKQAYLQAMKEMQEAIDKAKADAAALDDKTTKLDEQITKTFSDLDTSIQNMHEQLQKEADRMNQELIDTKSDLTKVRTDLQNAQLDNGRIHDELTNINGKFEHKVWQTDLDPLKEQIERAETSVQQTKDELLGKASREDLDTVTNAVSKLDTQLKETAKGVEISVKKDELSGDVARLLNDKTNLLLGTRNFSGEDNWKNRDAVTIEPGYYKGLKSVAIQELDSSIYQPYHVKANTAYTFSFFGKEDKDNPKATLIIKPIDAPNINIDNAEQPVHITTEWQRFAVTFSADQDCDISIQIIQGPEANNNILHLAGFKLQYGQNNTPWEPNEADVAENIEHTESQFNVYSDQIAGIVKKQEKMGDTERQLDTRITETAEGLKQTSKDLQDANGKITEFRGQLESTARGLKTEYEKYTNDAVGQISDSTLNLIRNSSFQNKDSDFDQWQNVSAKANVRSDENGLRWVELTQSGLTTGNPQGITSNYFNVKQGKVTIAVDIKSGDKATLDNESVLFLELYNDAKKRVDFRFVTLSELGLSNSLLGDHQVHRGLYRLGIDRNDAKYMTVKAHLMRNGDLYFTNFSARLSSIDDGAYEPNPDDINQQILKQNTKIEQNAKEVAIKANSVDVTRDIKSAVDNVQVGGTNLLKNSVGPFQPHTDNRLDNYSEYHDSVVELVNGEQYTISGTTNGVFSQEHNPSQESDKCVLWLVDDAGINQIVSDENTAKGTTFTWNHPTKKYVLRVNTYHPGSTNQIKAWKIKIEKGNKATDWSPAPEDVSEEIKSAKDAAIQVASDQINIHVNELSTQFDDKLNKRINEQKTASEKFTTDGIEQTVTKITNVKNDVDRLGDTVNSIGSRNLLHNTSDRYKTLTGNGYLAQSTASDIYTSTANYHGGDWFTYAATITNNSSKNVTLETWLFDQNKQGLDANSIAPIQLATHSADVYPGEKDKRVSTSFQISGTTWFIRTYVIFDGGGAPNGSQVQVKDERLVEGRLSGDWSPNPEDINKKIDTQILDSANIDNLKTQGHYFVKNLTGNPIGGWVYVDVTGNNNDRVRQDVYQDNGGKHMSRRLFGTSWSDWEQGAYLSDVNAAKTEVTASVKNLGDRVTTEVNSITTRMSDQIANAVELVQKSDFSDGSKGSWTVQSIISATNPAPPAELGISGMKVIQSNVRDSYEDVWHSVTPGEKFNIDFWCAPSGVYDSSFGLVFYDANKKLVPNNQWLGVRTDHSGQWKHYTGEITAPGNSAFAKPWFQIDMPFGQHNTSWLAKPHIRRQDPRVTEAIREVNTKWDVANGQIQGKVTETQVNNILNGKGYATQSWAQTMFQMKSDSITLQAVRDNITNGIQNQVNSIDNRINDTNNRIDTTNSNLNSTNNNLNNVSGQVNGLKEDTIGDLSNICRNPNFRDGSTRGWEGVGSSTGNGQSPSKYYGGTDQRDAYYGDWFPVASGDNYYFSAFAWQDTSSNNFNLGFIYQKTDGNYSWQTAVSFNTNENFRTKQGTINIPSGVVKARIWIQIDAASNFGNWYFTNVNVRKNDVISQINITPDQIKIASNKIVIDGNTDIHGTLRVPDVKLAGRNGNVDLSGDGINITKTNGAGINIASNGIQLTANTNGQNEIEGVITTAWSMNNKNQNGIGLVITPEQTLGRPYGGDILTIGEMVAPGTIHAGMVFDATGINPDYKRGFNWFAPHTLNGDGGVLKFPGAQDDLMLYPGNMPESRQSEYSQPTLRLVHGNSQGSAGVQFQWYDIVPFGRITSSMSYVSAVGTDDDGGITVSWYSYGAWYNGRKAPSIVYRGSDGNRGNGGIVFYPYGEVCFWQGDFHSNLRWSGMKNTD